MVTVFCQLRAPPLIRAPPSLEEPNAIIIGQNRHTDDLETLEPHIIASYTIIV